MAQNLQWDIVKYKLFALKLNDNNPRKITDEKLLELKEQIEQVGFNTIIIVDNDNIVIGGNQRVRALKQIYKDEPEKEIEVRKPTFQLTEHQRKQIIIQDNKHNGEFDFDILLKDFNDFDLKKELQIDLSNINTNNIDDDFATKNIEEDNISETKQLKKEYDMLSEEQKKLLDKATLNAYKEFFDIVDILFKNTNYYSTDITKNRAELNFLTALFLNKSYNTYNSISFHPEMNICKCLNKPTKMELYKQLSGVNGSIYKYCCLMCGGSLNFSVFFKQQMPLCGIQCVSDFNPNTARDIYNKYGNNGKILDMCAGWGGRMIGYLLSNCNEYVGYDTNPEAIKGNNEIYQRYNKYVNKKVVLKNKRFQDNDEQDNYFDIAFTSPPYYDTEKYDGEQSSWREYKTYSDWLNGFYYVMIDNAIRCVKNGGYFILNIGNNKYDLSNKLLEYLKDRKEVIFLKEDIPHEFVGFNKTKIEMEENNTGEHFYYFKVIK